jgi:hypothetical protein
MKDLFSRLKSGQNLMNEVALGLIGIWLRALDGVGTIEMILGPEVTTLLLLMVTPAIINICINANNYGHSHNRSIYCLSRRLF